MRTDICFECSAGGDIHMHHVVPRVLGGTKMVPLCEKCHSLVHDRGMVGHSRLVRKGQDKAMISGHTMTPDRETIMGLFLTNVRVCQGVMDKEDIKTTMKEAGVDRFTVLLFEDLLKGFKDYGEIAELIHGSEWYLNPFLKSLWEV